MGSLITEALTAISVMVTPLVPAGSSYVEDARNEVGVIDAIAADVAPPPFKDMKSAIDGGAVLIPLEKAEWLATDHAEAPVSSPKRREINSGHGVWDRLAVCESGAQGVPRWDYNGSSGFDGGIQFHPKTWTEFKLDGFPDYAYQASAYQQIQIGKLVLKAQGVNAWPTCGPKAGLSMGDAE